MLNTDSVRMYANLPSGIFSTNTRISRSESHDNHRNSDYFASSTDFEYDLFLRGIVSCDPSTDVVYRSGTTSATANRKSLNSGFLSRVTQRSSQRKKNQNSSSLFSSVTSLNRVAFDPFVPRPPRADSYDNFDSSQSIRFCDLSFDDDEFGFKKSSSLYQNAVQYQNKNRKNLQTTVIEEEFESPTSGENLSHQQQHALHRFRRQKKKGIISKLRDAVISFTPKSRPSIIGRNDIFFRYGKAEQDTLDCFNFLEDELQNCSTLLLNSAINYSENDHSSNTLVDYELLNNTCCDISNQSIPQFITQTSMEMNIVIEKQTQEYIRQTISNPIPSCLMLKEPNILLTNIQPLACHERKDYIQNENHLDNLSSLLVCSTSQHETQINNHLTTATTAAETIITTTNNNNNNNNNTSLSQNRPTGSNKSKKKSKQKSKNNKYRK